MAQSMINDENSRPGEGNTYISFVVVPTISLSLSIAAACQRYSIPFEEYTFGRGLGDPLSWSSASLVRVIVVVVDTALSADYS